MTPPGPFTTTTTTTVDEVDTLSPKDKTKPDTVKNTTTTVVAQGATTNQFEHAVWRLDGGAASEVVLSLQLYSVVAIFLAIYRITNDDDSNPVAVLVDQKDGVHSPAKFVLQPGTSIDVSWENVTIQAIGGKSASGTYQYINSALASQAQAQPKAASGGSGGGGGKGGGGNGGGDGGGDGDGNGNGDGGDGGGDSSGDSGSPASDPLPPWTDPGALP